MQSLHRVVQDIAGDDASDDAALLKAVLRHLPYASFILLPADRTIAWCNAAVRDLLGYQPDQLIGESTRVLHLDEAHYREFHARCHPPVSRGRPFRGRYWLRHRDGASVPTDHLVIPVHTLAGHPVLVSFVQSLHGDESPPAAAARDKLSPMERRTFELMRRGHTAKQAARALGCSPRTVEVHRSRVLAKLGYASAAEMMAALLQAKNAFAP